MENNKTSIVAQFFTGIFSGAILGVAVFIALTNTAATTTIGQLAPLILFISVLLGVILGIVTANKTRMTRQARIVPWLGIGFFLLPPVLLVGAIGRLTPHTSDPMETYFWFLFMIGIMATSIVLSAIITGIIKWTAKKS